MSGASALAESPGRIESIFHNDDNAVNANGIYALDFYTLGIKHTVIVDDWLPLSDAWSWEITTLFAHVGADKGIWALILEKAFAKYHGNYQHIIGGNPVYSARTLSGAPYTTVWHDTVTADQLWEEMLSNDQANDVIQAGTAGGGNDQVQNSFGLAQSHAYTVLSLIQLTDHIRLVKMRNPWGSETYHGDWSDGSDLWTDEYKEAAGYVDADDGLFFITIEDYHSGVSETFFNKDVTDWHSSFFLMLDDFT
jgi:calpain-15